MRPDQLIFRVLACVCLAAGVSSQVYFPETEFHDPVQRVFPVECARVYVALAAEGGPATVTELVPEVQAREGNHAWKLVLKDARGGTVRTAQVSYPDKQLRTGAAHYRAVARDIARQLEFARPKESGTPESFWRGATLTKTSREASLGEAFGTAANLRAARSPDSLMRLAGLLAHSTLPAQAGQVSLDPLLLARSAALLAYAEAEGAAEAMWAPVLFQSGRAGLAGQAWKTRPSSWTNGAYARAWEVWLGRPTTQQIFLAACDSESFPMGMAMLYFDAIQDQTWALLEDLLPGYVGTRERLAQLHNYGPISAAAGSIGLGHQFASSAVYQRRDWVKLLGDWASNDELPGIGELVASASKSMATDLRSREALEPSLIGLKSLGDLYRKAEQESRGPLRPVVVATSQDLLAYGWEMAGWQLGARYRFLFARYGSQSEARPVIQTGLGLSGAWSPLFLSNRDLFRHNLDKVTRLQSVTEMPRFAGIAPHPYGSEASLTNSEAAATFVQRAWLQAAYAGWYANSTGASSPPQRVTEVLERLVEEGGGTASDSTLDFLAGLHRDAINGTPGLKELRLRLAREARQPTATTLTVLRETLPGSPNTLEQAQALERLYWQNTDSRIESSVFTAYAMAGYTREAKQFYMRVRSQLGDPVSVSSGIGRSAWILGLCTEDEELRHAALEDGESASFNDMMLNGWEAAIQGDADAVKEIMEDMMERYSNQRDAPVIILNFLPLLPALADAKHPKHVEALDHFGDAPTGILFRWIWARRFKLSQEDAIRFLGGTTTTDERSVLVELVRKDSKSAKQALSKAKINSEERRLMVSILCQLSDPSARPESKPEDVRPPGVRFTREVVTERLGLSRPERRKP